MKYPIFFVMITCWAPVLVAQQLSAGLGVGSRVISTGMLMIDSVQVEITNPRDQHYLVPGVELAFNPGQDWRITTGLQFQSGSLSIGATDIQNTPCVLCDVRKGTLVSFYEMITGANAGYNFIKKGEVTLHLDVGLSWNYRFAVRQSPTAHLKNMSNDALYLLGKASEMIKRSYLNSQFGVGISWRRWSMIYQSAYLFGSSVGDEWEVKGANYPVKINQRFQIIRMQYQLLSF